MKIDDYKLSLLKGEPIQIDYLTVYPLTLQEIEQIGYEQYSNMLNVFFIDLEDLELENSEALEDINKFILFLLILEKDSTIRNLLLSGLKLFCKQDFTFDKLLMCGEETISEEIWEKMKYVLSWQNGIKYKTEDLTYNFANVKAKEIQKKIKENKKRVQEIKNKQNENPELVDLISAFCSKHPSINLFDVWQLTYYQLLDQLTRLQLIEEYEFGLKSILAGADSKKIKINHWVSKL